jgi:ABC-type branched-subunit amino acid transport system substrate-binding protein
MFDFRNHPSCAFILLVANFLAISAMGGCGSQKMGSGKEHITIGAILPFYDRSSEYIRVGMGIHAGVGLYTSMETINRSGGILGKHLDVIIMNGQSSPITALANYKSLKDKGAAAIIWATGTIAAESLENVAKVDGMPIFAIDVKSYVPIFHREYGRNGLAKENLNKNYIVNFGHEPPPSSIAACEGICILAAAIEMAGSTKSEDLNAAINAIKQELAVKSKDTTN